MSASAELEDQSVTEDSGAQPPAVRCRHNTPATGYIWICVYIRDSTPSVQFIQHCCDEFLCLPATC